MGRTYDELRDELVEWIEDQHVFFVATAPSGPGGHVNLSPKGYDTFRVLDPHTVAYLDLTGSGVESIAHLRENGRIVVMCCAFDGPPRVLRLHGHGEVLEPGDTGFPELLALFAPQPGVRAVVRIHLERISTTCGYGVPLMGFTAERERLREWAEQKGPDGVEAYRVEKNSLSIDGLPGLGR